MLKLRDLFKIKYRFFYLFESLLITYYFIIIYAVCITDL